MGQPIVHWEIVSEGDSKEVQSFYADLFGWKFDLMEGMDYGMVSADANGGGIPGGVGSGPDPSVSYQTVYAGVDDVEGTLAKAESLGAKTVAPPMDLPAGGRIALFVDPQGHTFGLVKPPPESDYIN